MPNLVQRTGRVVAHDGYSVRIAFNRLSDCANCESGFGCGIGPVVGMMKSTCVIRLSTADPAVAVLSAGDRVCVGINARQLTVQVLLVYLLPVIGLLVGAVCAGTFVPGASDLDVGIGALVGLFGTYLGARGLRVSLDLDTALQPRIAQRLVRH